MGTVDLLRESIAKGARFSLDATFPVVITGELFLEPQTVLELERRVRDIVEIFRAERRRRVTAGDIAALTALAIVREHADAFA